jgi:hypothetical protein
VWGSCARRARAQGWRSSGTLPAHLADTLKVDVKRACCAAQAPLGSLAAPGTPGPTMVQG